MKAKTLIRKRILWAFISVLFFSFALTGVLFNILIRLRLPGDDYYGAAPNTGTIGIILLMLVSVMFIVAVIGTFFLAQSITHPIKKLERFALNIGHGGFETNEYEFIDIELDNLNIALNKAVKQIKAYDSEQKNFFQNASHELRTPLMSIKVYAEGIMYDVMEPKKAAETILDETDRLSDLVTDLLYIAKIDNAATVYTAETVDLAQLIKDRTSRLEALAEKNGIKFVLDLADLQYNCVQDLLSRAVDNLVSNAIRYAKSEIAVTCRKQGSSIQIIVADDGDGIDAEALPHVFERFYKGKGGNTGVGLSIVKSIANQHNGYVTAENNNGAIFTITLPGGQ